MSNDAEYGELVSVAIVVHVPAPAGERSKSTWSTPDPVSAAEPVSVFVARRNWPGSSWLVVGTVLSTRTSWPTATVVWLPAKSVITTCTL